MRNNEKRRNAHDDNGEGRIVATAPTIKTITTQPLQ